MIKYIEDVETYLKWVDEIKSFFDFKEDDPFMPWFRGQCSEWELCPKLYRSEFGNIKRHKEWNIENEIREEFIIRAPALSNGVPEPNDDWGWYFLMQHYGAPTRLLDWTESAFLALYFAVNDNIRLTNGIIWALNPYKLNKIAMGRSKDCILCPNVIGLNKSEIKSLKPWLPQRFSKKILPPLPMAVYPTHMERRIGNQRSCFTIHGSNRKGLETIFEKQKAILVKAIIPSFKTSIIRRQLQDIGIDETTAYPDLSGLGRALCLKWQIDNLELPHKGVSTRLQKSSVHGIGVFAIKRIEKGDPLFVGDIDEMPWFDEKIIPDGPKHIRDLYDDFSVIKNKRYGCPRNFNRLTMSWYINEARNRIVPNVRCNPETYEFSALKDIKIGDELFVKYDYSESPLQDKNQRQQKK